jgi:hypothetical protein
MRDTHRYSPRFEQHISAIDFVLSIRKVRTATLQNGLPSRDTSHTIEVAYMRVRGRCLLYSDNARVLAQRLRVIGGDEVES